MKYVLTGLGVPVALVMIAASCALNFDYWSGQGETALQSLILGAFFVAADVFKPGLPVGIALAVRARRFVYVGLASIAFLLFLAASITASIGFLNKTRGAKVGTQEALSARYLLVRQELAELDARLARLPATAPVATIEARIKAQQQNWRWTSTKDCTDATASASRSFCTAYFAERERLGAAAATARLTERRKKVRAEVTRLQQMGATLAADPQVQILSRFMPWIEASDAKLGLTLFIAVFIEVGAALGLYLATGHGWVAAKLGERKLTGILGTRQSESQFPVSVAARDRRPCVTIDLQPEMRPFALKPPRPPKAEGG